MKIAFYHLDTFTDSLFAGNPAGVCSLGSEWIEDSLMQKIAAENNLSETAFYIFKDNRYQIRWFTPAVEVDLCGHATLASAYVLFNLEGYSGNVVEFDSRSGVLRAEKDGGNISLDFPVDEVSRITGLNDFKGCFNHTPVEVYKGKTDYMLVFDTEDEITSIKFSREALIKLEARGFIVTARGSNCDFVYRFFAPGIGVDEDPVTGSACTTLVPYWAEVTGNSELKALQLSKRGGLLKCSLAGDRVGLSGNVVVFMRGEIEV